jgi:uncharacterized protein
MTTTSWDQYGLITYIAQRQTQRQFPLGKTKLQKLVYLMQDLHRLPTDYRFHFYTYGPFCSGLSGDASYLDAVGGLRIQYVGGGNMFEISPGANADFFRNKAASFLAAHTDAVDPILDRFGSKSAREMELIATLVYVMHYDPKYAPGDRAFLIVKVEELKPKFSEVEVNGALDELAGYGYLGAT